MGSIINMVLTSLLSTDLIFTDGDSWAELKDNILEAVNLFFVDENWVYTIDEIKLKPDLQSFFKNSKLINAKVLGEWIGVSQSLLSAYINGIKRPSLAQTKRIFSGIKEVGRELVYMQF